MGNPATEQDVAPSPNTFRAYVRNWVAGLSYLRAFWGRRLVGGAIGLMADAIAEGARQTFYARLPGHPQQAPDSLVQVGKDRDLFRFRGETDANWLARVQAAWSDYAQAGTPIQMLHAINQWGQAASPGTWNSNLLTLVESGNPTTWTFTITIPFGMLQQGLLPWTWGDGHKWGQSGLYWGVGVSSDLPALLWVVSKWKRSASVGYVNVYYSVSNYVQFVIQ